MHPRHSFTHHSLFNEPPHPYYLDLGHLTNRSLLRLAQFTQLLLTTYRALSARFLALQQRQDYSHVLTLHHVLPLRSPHQQSLSSLRPRCRGTTLSHLLYNHLPAPHSPQAPLPLTMDSPPIHFLSPTIAPRYILLPPLPLTLRTPLNYRPQYAPSLMACLTRFPPLSTVSPHTPLAPSRSPHPSPLQPPARAHAPPFPYRRFTIPSPATTKPRSSLSPHPLHHALTCPPRHNTHHAHFSSPPLGNPAPLPLTRPRAHPHAPALSSPTPAARRPSLFSSYTRSIHLTLAQQFLSHTLLRLRSA